MLEVNKIYNADCLELMKQLPDKCIDLVLTDPPYGIGVNNMTMFDGAKKQKRHKEYKDEIPPKDYFDEIFRISKNQIIFGGNYFIEYLKNTRCCLIWDKIQDFSGSDFELAWTSFDKVSKSFKMSRIEAYGKGTEHPTQKPVKLIEWCIDYSKLKEGSLILDCFSGSGTTAIAAFNKKMDFICIEKDYDYWKASVERLENAQAQCKLF